MIMKKVLIGFLSFLLMGCGNTLSVDFHQEKTNVEVNNASKDEPERSFEFSEPDASLKTNDSVKKQHLAELEIISSALYPATNVEPPSFGFEAKVISSADLEGVSLVVTTCDSKDRQLVDYLASTKYKYIYAGEKTTFETTVPKAEEDFNVSYVEITGAHIIGIDGNYDDITFDNPIKVYPEAEARPVY